MTKEDKELLLKDLCARLPFGVKIQCTTYPQVLTVKGIINNRIYHTPYFIGVNVEVSNHSIEDVKPYLRPMSSMTEEEKKEFEAFHCVDGWHPEFYQAMCNLPNINNMNNWVNRKMFDHRGLIPMGLALEAPEDMYHK